MPQKGGEVRSGSARQNFFDYAPDNTASDLTTARGLPDQLSYTSPAMVQNFTVAGPIMMNLAASLASTDADFYVSVSDLTRYARTKAFFF